MELTWDHRIYKNIADTVGKNSYRGDLNNDAVKRASALRQAQKSKKDTPPSKTRGSKAKKQEQASS